jgi:hypothetical protein
MFELRTETLQNGNDHKLFAIVQLLCSYLFEIQVLLYPPYDSLLRIGGSRSTLSSQA